jgi:hypothetical protein
MEAPPVQDPSRLRDMFIGLAVIVASFVGCLLLSLWGMHESTPRLAPEPAPPTQIGLEGFPNEVRPLEILEVARKLTVRDRFLGFVAEGVRPNGSVDLGRDGASIRFAFQSPSGLGPQPLRKGGTLPTRRFCGLQSVFVDSTGLFATEDNPERPCPGNSPEAIEVPEKCTLEDVWNLAKKRKMAKRGWAQIEYFHAPSGGAYRFKMDKESFVVSGKDCSTVLKGRAAVGVVP